MASTAGIDATSPSLLVLWRQNPIFAVLDDTELHAFTALCRHQRLEAGAPILEAGEPVADLHVLLAGTVRIFHRAADGREAVVKLLRAPSVFAELELLHDLPMLESVDAVDQVLLACAPAPDYFALLHRFPAAMFAHFKHLAAAFCVAVRNEQQVFAPLEARVANLLLSYADLELASPDVDGVELASALSQTDIAKSLGAAQRSVARILSAWQHAGTLERSADRWVLRDRAALEELARPIRHSLNYQMGMSLGQLAERASLARARLEITRGHPRWVGRTFDVEDEIIVGRQPPAKLILPSDVISPQHCRIFRASTGGRYWLEDLESLNGSEVNGRAVKRCVLRDGDTIRVGGFELTVRLDKDAGG